MSNVAPSQAADRIVAFMGSKRATRETALRAIDTAFEKGKLTQIESRQLEGYADRKWPA